MKKFFASRRRGDLTDTRDAGGAGRYFLAGFILTVLAAAIGFISLGVWPFGDQTLLIIDSLHQYLPFYTDLQQKLSEGESLLYSFSGGLGYNFWSTIAYYMASPVNLLLAFIPRENVCDFMDLMILLKIGLCGGCFSWYLHRRDPARKYLPAVFGMAFGLSNFVIGYYFNLMWLDSVAMLPLIMAGIERITEGKSGRLYGISLFYGLWCNYYIGFMLCFFSCLYFLVRHISQKKIVWKRVGKSCLSFFWYSLLAGGMAALILLPAFMGLSTSESMQGNTFPTTIRFYESLADLLENHLAFLPPVNISSTQVGLNAYCGIFTVLLALLYLLDKKISLRERLAHLGLCAFLLLSFAFNILNYIWHGFHVQNGLPNRFVFIYIALLLVIAYDALGHIRSFHLVKLTIAFLVPVGFVAYCYLRPEREHEPIVYLVSAGLLFLYFGLLLLGKFAGHMRPAVYCGVLSAVMLSEVTANAIYGIASNGGVTRSIYIADQKSYQTMMAQQPDAQAGEFFRSEVDRQRMRNVTMYAGGNAMVMFNSTMHESIVDFCDSLGIEARTNKNGYLGVTKLINDVLGIRYVASPSKLADTMYQFTRVAEDGELALYKNDQALSLGFMVKDSIADWDIRAGEPLQVQNSFVELATGLDPIFVLDRTIDMEDGENYGIKIPEDKQVYLCIDTRVAGITLNTPEYTKTFEDYTDHLYVINSANGKDMADFTVTLNEGQSSVQAHVYTCANDAYEQVVRKLAESQLTNVKVDGSRVSADLDAKEDGTLMLTVPYDEGWTVYVDGEETEYFRIGEALMGLKVGAGAHTIEMEYMPPGFVPGALLSVLCIALYICSGIVERRHPNWFAAAAEAELPAAQPEAGEGHPSAQPEAEEEHPAGTQEAKETQETQETEEHSETTAEREEDNEDTVFR
ncbi:MAG TPA: YfhO family protein [Candidatus Choladousia intestinipullorum]|nr:YfhO family protein [Candidatus Choladousia intestinipullorum]